MWTEWNDGVAVRLLEQFIQTREIAICEIALDAMQEAGECEGHIAHLRGSINYARTATNDHDNGMDMLVFAVNNILEYPSAMELEAISYMEEEEAEREYLENY